MARIYSWRLTKQDYAYLYIPNSNEHISKRITDIEKIDAIVDVVSKMSKTEYRTYFDAMNNSINNYLGVRIPWDEAFCDVTTAISNKVIYNSDTGKMDEIRDDILADLTEDIAEFKEEMVQKYTIFKQENEEKLLTVLNNARENFQNALNTLSGISGTVQSIINEKSAIFDQASQVLKLDSQGINAASLQKMFSENTEIKRWKDEYSGGIRTLINDYNTYAVADKNFDKNNGIFVGLKKRINSAETAISFFKDETTAEIKKTLSAETESLKSNLDGKISNTVTDKINKLNIEDKIGQVITTNYGDIDGKFGDLTSRINSLSDDFGSWSGSVFQELRRIDDDVKENFSGITENLGNLESEIEGWETNLGERIETKLNDDNFFNAVIGSKFDNKFSEINGNIGSLNTKFDNKFSEINGNIGSLNTKFEESAKTWNEKFNEMAINYNTLNSNFSTLNSNFSTFSANSINKINQLEHSANTWNSVENRLVVAEANIDDINGNMAQLDVTVKQWDKKFSGVTWGSGSSIPLASSRVSTGFEYRTSTGYEIVVDDETIRLKSDKAQIIIKDDGIHLEGDVFINGVKI
jgi:hypothetical protein